MDATQCDSMRGLLLVCCEPSLGAAGGPSGGMDATQCVSTCGLLLARCDARWPAVHRNQQTCGRLCIEISKLVELVRGISLTVVQTMASYTLCV
eukprot:1141197-Pelagomonas_calceolata.AAC.2